MVIEKERWGEIIQEVGYIQPIFKKDLLNSTGNATEHTVRTYTGKRNRERIHIRQCITESSSSMPKTNTTLEINSTPI